jgi:hypothetical protein
MLRSGLSTRNHAGGGKTLQARRANKTKVEMRRIPSENPKNLARPAVKSTCTGTFAAVKNQAGTRRSPSSGGPFARREAVVPGHHLMQWVDKANNAGQDAHEHNRSRGIT